MKYRGERIQRINTARTERPVQRFTFPSVNCFLCFSKLSLLSGKTLLAWPSEDPSLVLLRQECMESLSCCCSLSPCSCPVTSHLALVSVPCLLSCSSLWGGGTCSREAVYVCVLRNGAWALSSWGGNSPCKDLTVCEGLGICL